MWPRSNPFSALHADASVWLGRTVHGHVDLCYGRFFLQSCLKLSYRNNNKKEPLPVHVSLACHENSLPTVAARLPPLGPSSAAVSVLLRVALHGGRLDPRGAEALVHQLCFQ